MNGELGDEEETIEQVDAGVIDIARVDGTILVPYVSEIEVFTLPYIFDDDAHKWSVFEGEIGEQIGERLAEKGFVNLGFLESGWRSFYSTKEINSLADLKGLKIRVQDSQVYIKMMDLFGANATPMSFSEVFLRCRRGLSTRRKTMRSPSCRRDTMKWQSITSRMSTRRISIFL